MFDKSSEKKLTQDSQKNPSPQRKKKSCRIPMKKKKINWSSKSQRNTKIVCNKSREMNHVRRRVLTSLPPFLSSLGGWLSAYKQMKDVPPVSNSWGRVFSASDSSTVNTFYEAPISPLQI